MVRGFDHVCPFTGTAIGESNLKCFYCFVGLVQALIYITIGIFGVGMYTIYARGHYNPPI